MSQASPVAGSSPRIYVVDDEWILAESLATILTKDGYHAQAFHNPGQAMVRALDQPPDELIANVMMPGVSGTELAMELRSAGQQCRILLFSGQASAVDLLSETRRRGFDFELLEARAFSAAVNAPALHDAAAASGGRSGAGCQRLQSDGLSLSSPV